MSSHQPKVNQTKPSNSNNNGNQAGIFLSKRFGRIWIPVNHQPNKIPSKIHIPKDSLKSGRLK